MITTVALWFLFAALLVLLAVALHPVIPNIGTWMVVTGLLGYVAGAIVTHRRRNR